MTIRDLTPGNIDAAAALWHRAGLTRPWNSPELDAQRALDGDTSTVLGAFDDERLVGTIMVGHDGHRGWAHYLAVDEGQRGTGLGKRMMAAAENWLRTHGCEGSAHGTCGQRLRSGILRAPRLRGRQRAGALQMARPANVIENPGREHPVTVASYA
ncbi:GNAT family N-acetyltransferase [Cryobacterium sp. TMT1-66-1]|uniref:GNAT family N-acetyltransferase n=1 Tax=Cryobacterium sp. TMT1-66-1 TaxID=1259242 RepID=UPI001F5401ED|nr:GNAT family N-acetyltransferase [Cryobacterium sp. TMT1-66-1]